jgi:Flp pilus assembly pilin Flp
MPAITILAGRLWLFATDVAREERGQGLVEYGLVAGLIAVVSILVLEALGVDIFELLDQTQQQIPDSATPSTPAAN